MDEKKDVIVKSLDRTLDVLDLLSRSPQPLSVQQLSDALGVNRTTLYAALNTLCLRNYIEKDEVDGRYSIAYRMYEIGLKFKYKFPFIQSAEEQATQLFLKFRQQINVGVFQPPDSIVVIVAQSPVSMIYSPFLIPSTYVVPAHASAIGKLLLSGMGDEFLHEYAQNTHFKPYTDNSILHGERLLKEIEAIRINGYATDKEEFVKDVNCIAAPIYDFMNHIVAGISVSCMNAKFLEENVGAIKNAVMASARQISISLGWKL